MFTYYIHDGPSAFRLQLSGALTDTAAAELEQCVNTALSTIGSRVFAVDINGLTAAGEVGQELLRRWGREGARFLAASCQAQRFGQSILGYSLPVDPAPEERTSFPFLRLALASSAVLLVLFTVARAAGFVR